MSAPFVIDAWMQHPTQRFLAQPYFASLRRWLGEPGIPQDELPITATLASLDASGVRLGLLSAWHGPQGELISNDEVAAAVAAAPDRLVGIASVDISRPMAAVAEIRRAVGELGFKGVRVLPWLWNLPPDDRRFYPVYVACCELGVPFCLQVGHTGPLCPSEPGRPIPYLENVALDFPELKIVAGHIGAPWAEEMISLATKFPNLYIDSSAYKASRYPPAFVNYLRGHGRKKVLFGSNYPMLTAADCLRDLDSLELDDDAQQRFLYQNAERVFGLS